ncbi:hypothetical protein AEGHOMDF_3943 [Methylobacterium soli]|nr:hypothetical protein AEGHOMDF_3943 [Methylobacterium soli]
MTVQIRSERPAAPGADSPSIGTTRLRDLPIKLDDATACPRALAALEAAAPAMR